ncbi:hypothetical protein [Desulfosediminicola sp.]|uniref:hypothetical protein n=1 Tax=Desulfosediminicola sp. TaxID=2886825 RepID=UPI003AF2AFBC
MRKRMGHLVMFFLTTVMILGGDMSVRAADNGGDEVEAPDYGDQVILYRDGSGVPLLTDGECPEGLLEECTATQAFSGFCRQPIASQAVEGCTTTIENQSGDLIDLVNVDPETCAPQAGCESLQMEVELGRINLVRSPIDVLEAQLEEALYSLTTAACLATDAAGRQVYGTLVVDADGLGTVETHTIDSPLQNLAIFWKLMKDGNLDARIDGGFSQEERETMAMRGLGAALDKEGKMTVDVFSYMTEIMDLTGDVADGGSALFAGRYCIDMRQEVQGVIKAVTHCYLDLDDFSYDRAANFNALPDPAYVPAGAPELGKFQYLVVLDKLTKTLQVQEGEILAAVPELIADQALVMDGIEAFAQAADDTRATIEFMHSWEVPDVFKTPQACEASAAVDVFDVRISEYSGLQVPVRMVAGAEDREIIVTIENVGPAPASGVVWVTAVMEDSELIIYDVPYDFADLPAGETMTWPPAFVPDDTVAGVLSWTAEIVTELADGTEPDVNLSNNIVYETTTVVESGGSGGGH